MKAFYTYDPKSGKYTGSGFADTMPENATEVPPVIRYDIHHQEAMKNPIFCNGKWIEDSDQQATAAALTKQIMGLQLANKQQEATMAALTKQMMALQLKED